MQIGIVGLIGVVFVVLKLVGTITWSWWLVLLPFYGGLLLLALGFLVYGVILAAMAPRKRRW